MSDAFHNNKCLRQKLLYFFQFVTGRYKKEGNENKRGSELKRERNSILVFCGRWVKAPVILKGNTMNTLISSLTILAILAIIFVPQALAIYFSEWRKSERDEYVHDGR